MNRLKLLLASSIVALLPGCALYDAYFMAGYDNQEYGLINKIRSKSEVSIADCNDVAKSRVNFNDIYSVSVEFRNFAQYIPNNKETIKLSGGITELAKQGKDMYSKQDVSQAFCELKLKQIVRTTEKAQQVIGNKPR